jgi:carboxyl-terminal processing protease
VEGGAPDPLALAAFDTAVAVVARTHWDEATNGVPWARLADSLRPGVAAAGTRTAARTAIRTMLARLGQSHFALFDQAPAEPAPQQEEAGPIGLDVRWIEGGLVVTDVTRGGGAAMAGVRPGWRLQAIDGCPVADRVSDALARWPRADWPAHGAMAGQALVDGVGPQAAMVFDTAGRAGAPVVTRVVHRRPDMRMRARFGNWTGIPVEFAARVDTIGGRRIGVIRFSLWFGPMVAPLDSAMDVLRDVDGLVVDLRGNGGGVGGLVMGIGGHFLDSSATLGTMRQRGTTLRFVTNPRRVSRSGQRVAPYAGPLAILTDALSLSTSELFAGGLQALGRARVFGERTGGMVLPALQHRLPTGDLLYHAVADFVDAGGRRLEGTGVVPDVPVPVDRSALLAGRDPVFEAAVTWLTGAARTAAPAGRAP